MVVNQLCAILLCYDTEWDSLTCLEWRECLTAVNVSSCDNLKRSQESLSIHLIAIRTCQTACVIRCKATNLKEQAVKRTILWVKWEICNISNVYIVTVRCDFNNWGSTNLDSNLTLRVVEEEVIVEQVIERLLHVACYSRLCVVGIRLYRSYNLIRQCITSIWLKRTACLVISVKILVSIIETVLPLIAHKTYVLACVTVLKTLIEVLEVPFTLWCDRLDEEQLTDREVHCLNWHDVISKQFAEHTADKWEYHSLERTWVVSGCCLIDKVLGLVFVKCWDSLFHVTVKTVKEV